ncbi:AraC family transcriptional regulator [Pedobacter sp. MC2016-24]|uniref:helix-turn-helix domain-containing protein n=1 Tax=Pedobacter sp. MC2016-24 TaxID=2780090 RepID=UPI0018809F10|nr:AraC family transcriptional regulator [Pedobacter sp. MC2016-24]MBE9598023.1 helix-turn-helix domain-containing protein [Pedobacter sp. MC2016-24]
MPVATSQSSEIIALENEVQDSFAIQHCKAKSFDKSVTYRLAYHRVILMVSGTGTILIDEQSFKIQSETPALYLIAKGQVISFRQGSSFSGYELRFGDCFWERAPQSANNCKAVLFDATSIRQLLPLSAVDDRELHTLFEAMQTESDKDNYINKLEVMAAYLKIIMIKMANVNAALADAAQSYESKIYRQFLALIAVHHQTSHEVADYARILGISTRKLADLSKQYGGKGAKELINEHLIAEAKRFLQFSLKPIKEIAFQLKFHSAEQFSHFFKKYTNRSPKAYRDTFHQSQ